MASSTSGGDPGVSQAHADEKQLLRAEIRALRSSLGEHQRRAASAQIAQRVMELKAVARCSAALLYGAARDEVDVTTVAARLRAQGAATFFPRVAGDDLAVIEVTDETPLEGGFRGILEPVGEPADPGVIDVVIVPGVAFDRSGNRLGQGKGYYDRLLPRLAAARIGVAYSCQIVDVVPTTIHDVRMDAIVTEEGIITPE